MGLVVSMIELSQIGDNVNVDVPCSNQECILDLSVIQHRNSLRIEGSVCKVIERR